MRFRLPQNVVDGGYRPRKGPFVASLLLHGVVCAAVWIGPQAPPPAPGETGEYTLAIAPRDQKLIWYRFRKELPKVSAAARVGTAPTPQGLIRSPHTIIATPKDAPPGKQFIWQPDERKLDAEVRAPNMIAVRRPERRFTPPETPAAPPPKAPSLPAPPEISPAARLEAPQALATAPTRLALRKFEPPARARLRVPEGVAIEQAPTLAIGGKTGTAAGPVPVADSGIVVPGKPKGKAFVAPPGRRGGTNGRESGSAAVVDLPPALAQSGPPGELSVAIVGLNPAANLEGPLPAGSRPVQLSAAPKTGAPATGAEVGGGGLVVPDLMVRGGGKPSAAPPPVHAPKITVYQETLPARWHGTFSVPLRSVSGRIPPSINGRFPGRDVYTMVIPIENLAGYSGDWIVWFADREQRTGATPQMRAPMPLRKVEPMPPQPGSEMVEGRVQLAATILKDGRLDSISPLRRLDARLTECAIEDLRKWEFRPAMRDGTAVDVDVVLEIPFRLHISP